MKVAYLDLDHTLMVNPFWSGVFPYVGRELHARVPGSDPSSIIRQVVSRAHAYGGDIRSHDWDLVIREVAGDLGATWTEPIANVVESHLSLATAVPGAGDMLGALRQRGWTLVVASQGFRRYQEPVVRHLGLWEYFDDAVFSDDVGTLKRCRRFYGRRADEAQRVVVVGDLYIDDALYPTWFGYASIWFTGVRRTPTVDCGIRPDFEVTRLSEIPDAFERIEADATLGGNARTTGRGCSRCDGPSTTAGSVCRLCRCVDLAAKDGRLPHHHDRGR